jgi:nucleolar protein 56
MEKKSLRKKLIEKAKKRVKEEFLSREIHIIKGINLLEDLDEMFNSLSGQVREWYAIHFPELNRLVKDNELFLELVLIGNRKNFLKENIEKKVKDSLLVEKILVKAKNSMGSNISIQQLKQIQSIARELLHFKSKRKELEKFVENEMSEEFPNFSKLCGPILGAKILAKIGSKKKLALMPSSTIQLIGAEKALFQHIIKGVKPPKHGLIFNHPLIRKTPLKNRGKMARALAGKLSIALREDFFGRKKIFESLQKSLNERFKQLSEKKG